MSQAIFPIPAGAVVLKSGLTPSNSANTRITFDPTGYYFWGFKALLFGGSGLGINQTLNIRLNNLATAIYGYSKEINTNGVMSVVALAAAQAQIASNSFCGSGNANAQNYIEIEGNSYTNGNYDTLKIDMIANSPAASLIRDRITAHIQLGGSPITELDFVLPTETIAANCPYVLYGFGKI